MFNKRKLMVLLLFSIVLISSVSLISAADSNATDVQTVDGDEIELEESDSNQDVLSAGNTYSDLNDLINSSTSSEIELDHDYAYSQYSDVNNNLIVERDNIVIDGKGHTITGSRNTRYSAYGFTVNSQNVVIKNINFVDLGDIYQSENHNVGAILGSLNKNLTVINCTFKYCYGYFGGAISSVSTVENCSFDYCHGRYGGAASSCGIIRNSNFTHCDAVEGGAVSQCDLVNCNFIENRAYQYGGAGRLSTFINCTFDGNSADDCGGAVYQSFSNYVVINCTFINNEASNTGGALYSSFGNYYVINSTFENNTAHSNAVSIRAHLVLCSFKNNVADDGVVYESKAIGTPTLYSTTKSYYFTCPDQVEIPINYAYKWGTGKDEYFEYPSDIVYLFYGINTTFELCEGNSYNVISKGSVLSGSSFIANLDKGRYTLRVRSAFGYSGEDYNIYVYGEKTNITAENNTEMYVGEDKYLIVNLTGSQNSPLVGFNVTLKENGNVLGNLTTDDKGQVSFSLKDLPIGVHNLYLEFLEDARHEASNLQVTVAVNRIPVVINADNVSAFYSEDTSLLVNLTDIYNNPMEGYVIYLMENGNVLANMTTNSSGQVRFSLNDIPAGSHNLYVEFSEDANYSSSILPVSVVISGSSTSIKADDVTAYVSDDLALLATLTDENNNPMAGHVLYLMENGNVLNNLTTNELGQVSFPLIGMSSGSHSLYVEFLGTRLYENSRAPVNVVIYKFASSISADNIDAFTIDDIRLAATLTDESGRPISGAVIYLKENGNVLANLTTDDVGQAIFSLNGISAGTHNLYVEFLENRYYEYSGAAVSAVINKPSTILQADKVVAFPNEGRLIAKLTDEFGNPITDAQVYLNLAYLKNKPLIHIGNGNYLYDLTGMASLNFTGTVTFNENDIYRGSSTGISVQILEKLNSNITSVDNITVFYAEFGILTTYLKDSNGNPIENGEIKLTVNGYYKLLRTDPDGRADFDLALFKLPAGSYDAVISFDSTTRYRDSVKHVNVTVNKIPTILIAPDVNCTHGDGSNLVVTLKDINGNPLKRQQVFVKFYSRLINQGTDDNGQARLVINIVPGTYDVEILFNGTNGYASSSAIAHIIVNEADENSSGHYSGTGHNQSGETQGNGSGQSQGSQGQGNGSGQSQGSQTPAGNGTQSNATSQSPAQNDVTTSSSDGENLVVTLKDESGNLIVNRDVIIEINGQTKSYKTNGKGQVTISAESLVPKTYKAKVTVLGDSKHKASSFNINIVVKKAQPKIVSKKKMKFKAKKVKRYTVYLKVGKKPIKNAKVTIKVKGKKFKKTFTAKTKKNGKAIFKLKKMTKKGTYKAVITYKGNNLYKKVTKSVKIIVK